MSSPVDTIAALATPHGTSAIAVIRASGPDTLAIATSLCGAPPLPRKARRANYHTATGQLVDDVLVLWFKGPHSYTGEDVLEISCHGSPLIAQKILADLQARGCRHAAPGEFTQRAFLNGKMDLTQAEAVMDVIQAANDRALAAANRQLRGGLSAHIDSLSGRIVDVLAIIEAQLDFPEEDLPSEDRSLVSGKFDNILLEINKLYSTHRYRRLHQDGTRIVIIGPPNAGKSSLLNRLVAKDRALVSPEAGTTRDFLEERIFIDDHLFTIVDTAGIHRSQTSLEELAIARALAQVQEADIILLVVDGSVPIPGEFMLRFQHLVEHERVIVVLNKSDLPPLPIETVDLLIFSTSPRLAVSALGGAGIDAIVAEVQRRVAVAGQESEDRWLVNSRHCEALISASELLQAASSKIAQNDSLELVASDLRGALSTLEGIIGQHDNEQLLDRLFASFCIGK